MVAQTSSHNLNFSTCSRIVIAERDEMPTSIRLDAETERRLDLLARRTGRSKSWYIRRAIQDQLDEWEEYFLALSRLEQESGDIDIAEVRRRLDLAG